MVRWGRAAIALIFLVLLSASAIAADRFALVIGNQAYNNAVGPLTNPHQDIALVGKALADVGFNVLAPRKDATRDEMLFAVYELAAQLRGAGRDAVGFVYYAGHGVAVGGENVLIPVNAENTTDAMLAIRGVRLAEILDILKRDAPDAVHFVVLDACRTIRGRRGDRGFVPVNDRRTGVVIAFSTAPGKTATDDGANGAPYARALAEEIVKPGQNDQAVFNAVRARMVSAASGQTPWTHDGLIGARLVFKAAPTMPLQSPSYSAAADAVRVCREVESMSNLSVLGVLANQHKGTPAGECITARIEELKQAKVATPLPVAPPTPAPLEKPLVQATPPPALKPGTVFRDCPDCPEMVVVPAGSFTMGSPVSEPERESISKGSEGQKQVTIGRTFAVGKFAISKREFARFITTTKFQIGAGCNAYIGGEWKRQYDRDWSFPGFRQDDDHPVVCVSWHDAKAYTAWLSTATGKAYRLLSETEREYVTRAGTTTPFWWGPSISTVQANYDASAQPYSGGGSSGEFRKTTVSVDSFVANPWGLYNVHGNVWEWTEDCWNPSNTSNPGDGSAQAHGDCSARVFRGGSFASVPRLLRSAFRGAWPPGERYPNVGFRVARTLE